MTAPRPPRLQDEEEMLLSAFLDGELAPEDRPRVEALLDARPEAVEWLLAARRLGAVGREIWGELADVSEAPKLADLVADQAVSFNAPASPVMRGFFDRFRRHRGNGSSET